MSEQKSINWRNVALVGVPLAAAAGVVSYLIYQQHKVQAKGKPDDQKSGNTSAVPAPTGIDSPDPLVRANAFKELGNRNFRVRRYDKAIANYTEAINCCPDDNLEEKAIFYQNRAAAYQCVNKDDEALADCDAALLCKPKYVKALSRRGKIYETKQRYVESLGDATAVCLFESFNNEENVMRAERVMRLLGEKLVDELLANQNPDVLQLPSRQFVTSFLKSFEHDPLQKEPLLSSNETETGVNGGVQQEGDSEAAVPTKPRGVRHEKLKLALQLLRQEEYNDASRKIQEMVADLEQEKTHASKRERLIAYLLRGTFLYLAFRTTEALQDFQLVVSEGEAHNSTAGEGALPNEVEDVRDLVVHALIKMANASPEDTDKGNEYFQRASVHLPNCSDIFFHRGQQRLVMESETALKQAVDDFDKAAKLCSQNPAIKGYYFYARILNHFRNSDMSRMEQDLERWSSLLEANPENYELHSLQGQFYVDLGQFDQAVQRFETAVKADPQSGTALVHLAMCKLRRDAQFSTSLRGGTNQVSEEVLSLLRRAVELEPRSVYAHEMFAMVLTQAADLEAAIEQYDTASRLPHHRKEVANLLALRESVRAQLNMMARFHMTREEMQTLRDGAMLTMVQKSQAASAGAAGYPFGGMGMGDS